jgi:hypothetical protein
MQKYNEVAERKHTEELSKRGRKKTEAKQVKHGKW